MNKKIKKILNKKNKSKIICLTAYSKNVATILDKHCDLVLVGDSLGSVLYNFKSTKQVTLETMINHSKSVRLGIKKSLMVVDMPYNTYRNPSEALKNSRLVMKETKCDAVKLEGGKKIIPIVKKLIKNKIPVMGHVGLLPQYSKSFQLKGKNITQKKRIFEDAMALADSGVFAIVIECVVEDLTKKITNSVKVPTIGIGSSKYCDGQILVTDDMIGMSNFRPKFVKQYSKVNKIIEKSVKNYCKDVKNKKFPFSKNVYKLKKIYE